MYLPLADSLLEYDSLISVNPAR